MPSSTPTEGAPGAAAPRVAFVTLGCPKNQVDSEVMMGLLARAGYALAAIPEEADLVVVNTCAFVRAAQEEAIAQILELAQGRLRSGRPHLLVAGCLAERHGAELLRQIPEIEGLVGPGRIEAIVDAIGAVMSREPAPVALGGFASSDMTECRLRTGAPHCAYVKIAEGCDHRCAYCLIPRLRGPQRSRTPIAIRDEVAHLGEEGVHEIILVAQDTTAYGRDLVGTPTLPRLLRLLLDTPGPEWIRLLYTHPDHWSEELIDLFAQGGRLLPYVDLPIQHIAAPVLRAMGRGRSGARIRSLVERLRARIPDLVLRSTVMTGHPGEGVAEFDELLRFLGEFPFDRLGVFAYSPEADTPAAALPRVGQREARQRRRRVLELQRELTLTRQRRRLGQVLEILTEAFDARRGHLLGRSYGEAPEIDGRVRIRLPRDVTGADLELGEFVTARVVAVGAYDLLAVPCGTDLDGSRDRRGLEDRED